VGEVTDGVLGSGHWLVLWLFEVVSTFPRTTKMTGEPKLVLASIVRLPLIKSTIGRLAGGVTVDDVTVKSPAL
jgi:hypothetical protein